MYNFITQLFLETSKLSSTQPWRQKAEHSARRRGLRRQLAISHYGVRLPEVFERAKAATISALAIAPADQGGGAVAREEVTCDSPRLPGHTHDPVEPGGAQVRPG